MSVRHALLSLTYKPLAAMNYVRRSLRFKGGGGRLRVLLFHDIAPDQYVLFREKIEWLSKHWKFVSPDVFADMLNGKLPIEGDSLLLTFDDGFCSDRVVAEEILNPMGIRALFFVISEFVKLQEKDEQLKFISNNLYPPSSGEPIPEHLKAMGNMTIEDLRYLVDTGHIIGSHTTSHQRLSTITVEEELIKETVSGADWLEDQLNLKIDHFSYSFGNLASFSKEALNIARSRFPYIFTGMRGDNSCMVPPWAIRRDTIAINDSLSLVGAFLEGAADFRYTQSLKAYESWASL